MPIIGFQNITDQTLDKIIELYGRKIKSKFSKFGIALDDG